MADYGRAGKGWNRAKQAFFSIRIGQIYRKLRKSKRLNNGE